MTSKTSFLRSGSLLSRHDAAYWLRIRILRFSLPVLAVLLLGMTLFWSEVSVWFSPPSFSAPSTLSSRPKIVQMKNQLMAPRIYSTDAKGRPYHIAANSAVQKNDRLSQLKDPKSTLQLEDGTGLEIKASEGFYDDTTKTLTYKKGVSFKTTTGYTLTTSSAQADLQRKEVTGTEAVKGEGPLGRLSSEKGFYADQEGNMILKGPSTLVIYPDQRPSSGERKNPMSKERND